MKVCWHVGQVRGAYLIMCDSLLVGLTGSGCIAWRRACIWLARCALIARAPLALLHGLQAATYPSSMEPPFMVSTRWSNSVALFFLHQWHSGSSASSSVRASLYFLVEYSFPIVCSFFVSCYTCCLRQVSDPY